jgi:hypothetical protein
MVMEMARVHAEDQVFAFENEGAVAQEALVEVVEAAG